MRPAFERTTRLRVFGALVFAFALPSLVLGQGHLWLSPQPDPSVSEATSLTLASLVFGVLLGWPYVAFAAGVWAILDHLDRHYWWTAIAVGLITGGAVAAFSFPDTKTQTHMVSLCLGLGPATGFGVWTIAYGRQNRLKAPKPAPAGRLVL
jgi:hypothetical protein